MITSLLHKSKYSI